MTDCPAPIANRRTQASAAKSTHILVVPAMLRNQTRNSGRMISAIDARTEGSLALRASQRRQATAASVSNPQSSRVAKTYAEGLCTSQSQRTTHRSPTLLNGTVCPVFAVSRQCASMPHSRKASLPVFVAFEHFSPVGRRCESNLLDMELWLKCGVLL